MNGDGKSLVLDEENINLFFFFYKMINRLSPNYLTQLVPDQVGQASSYSLRNAENLQNIHAGTQLYYKSFLPSVVRDWNALPVLSRNSPTVESFKRSLSTNSVKHHPISMSVTDWVKYIMQDFELTVAL